MNKHTPGPWVYSPDYRYDRDRTTGSEVVELVGYDVASEQSPVIGCEGIEAWFPNAEANARLIAAAPDLLEALLEAIDCGMVPISSAKEGGASAYSRQVRCADMIRAAIAKARGES